MEKGVLPGRYPAIVKSYNEQTRTCGVSIPGVTDGADDFLEAEIEYPIGDKSRAGANSTGIEIVADDTVWVAFIGGDARYPVITGYRNPQAGNSVDWRRWHHKNIEFTADTDLVINATTIKINGKVKITGDVDSTGKFAISGSSLTHNDINVGSDHKHSGTQPGTGKTLGPE